MGSEPDEAARSMWASSLNPAFQWSIDELGLSTRAYNCLRNAGVNTIGELAAMTADDLGDIRNFGASSASEVREKLQKLALCGPGVLAPGESRLQGRPSLSQRAVKNQRRVLIRDHVLEVLQENSGRALALTEIYEQVFDRVDFVPSEVLVRDGARELAKADGRCVKVGRDIFAWVEVGQAPPHPPAPPHVQKMIERRSDGLTLAEIGAEFGVTRERVRQLMKKYGGPTSDDVRERRSALESAEQQAKESAVAEELRGLLEERGPMSVHEVADATGHVAVEISRAWPPDLAHLRLHPTGRQEERWSDDAIIDAIREAAVYEYPLTTNAYAELLSQGQVRGPSMPRIWQRFGSWTAACEAAGVVPGQTMRPHYESRWSDEDLLRVARQYLLDQSAPNSAGRFDGWRRAVVPDGPSFQTLRNRFGSWTDVKRRALAQEMEPRE